jgi:hypothetical protein
VIGIPYLNLEFDGLSWDDRKLDASPGRYAYGEASFVGNGIRVAVGLSGSGDEPG